MRRRRAMRKPRLETAAIKESHSFTTLDAGTAYSDFQLSLARCPRAVQIAKGFQEYRIAKVVYMFKPLLDTFAAGTGTQIPYLYTLVDKTGANVALTNQEDFERAGCRPVRLDDKTITRTFKPAVLQYAYDAAHNTNIFTKPVVSPWLSCNKNNDVSATTWAASSIDHLGIEWLVTAGVDQKFQVDMVITYEFRKPAVLLGAVGTGAVQAPSRIDNEAKPPVLEV